MTGSIITMARRSSFSVSVLVALSVLASTSTLCHAQIPEGPMNKRGIPFPEQRFRQYRFLSDESIEMAKSLGYDEETWDHPGTANIELISFDGLGLGGSVVTDMGLTDAQWDCYVNHYRFMDWSELSDMSVQGYYVGLGWDRDMWRSIDMNDVPDSDGRLWDELTADQQGNATELCYFQEIWNFEKLQAWTTEPPTEPPTISPTMSPTVAPPTTDAPVGAPPTTNDGGDGGGGDTNASSASAAGAATLPHTALTALILMGLVVPAAVAI